MSAIEVKHLTKNFGPLLAVDDISFQVDKGEVLGFLGPNGAGKSTAMKMITGFLEPSAGTAVICGHDVLEEPLQLKEKIGYLPEGAPAYGEMTVTGFLRFIASIRGLEGEQRDTRIAEVIDCIHLEAVVNQRIETLSKGYKRRLGMAQAILHDPEILILDEPTDGLDPNQKHEVRTLINEMARDKAIIISTHILEEVDSLCTRAIIIARGKIRFDGSPEELESRSRLHNAVSLSLPLAIAATAERILGDLQDIATVEATPTGDSQVKLMLLPNAGSMIIEAVTAVVREQGWEAGEIRIEAGHLDEVFRSITTASETSPEEAQS